MADEFGKFKATLCGDLITADCHKLCTYFKLSPAQTESILDSKSQGLALLNQLECEGKIEPMNLHELRYAFEHLGMVAPAKKVKEYENSIDACLPDTLDSDEDEDATEKQSCNITFEELKLKCGITEKLTLNKMLEIKNPQTRASQAELFWTKIASLDYRITSSDLTQDNTLSVRDLIVAILHSSDNHLRQDIVNKMSSCQLAVPLVVNSVEGNTPLFFYWAFRTIRKKFQTSSDNDLVERPIFQQAICTVSFLRIGDVRVSKSDLLNSLLSECQGNQAHSFFTTSLNDLAKPLFCSGSIEVVWYIPQGDDKGFLKEATTFLNLRGDSQKFPKQTKFVCKVSNLIFALIDKQNWQTYKQTVDNIKLIAKKVFFLAIKETDDETTKPPLDFKLDGVIIVRKLQIKYLNEVLCQKIDEIQKSLSDSNFLALEAYEDLVKHLVQLDVPREYLSKIKHIVDRIVCSKNDVKLFKKKLLSLFPPWLKWAEIENTPITANYSEAKSREEQLALREETQVEERKKQKSTELSEKVTHFWEMLKLIDSKNDLFDDCLIYLRAVLLDLTCEYQGSISSSKKFIHDRMPHEGGASELKLRPQVDLRKTYLTEAREEWEIRIGIEDFIRELGQLFEAHIQCGGDHEIPTDIMRLPFLAAQFLIKGNPLEILDDRSYCIPRIWISEIFEELSRLLGHTAQIMVVCVIGVQGSGKSTLLNSMFGTKFPVSTGRCTRGLFIRLLKVEESFAVKLGCKHVIVIDTEGLRADHGGLFLDRASNRRLDNKMVTLAMCLADLIIVNIEGELISSDTTSFLEIAAYAVIRMKEVHLKSQCRIIQQRVSDITAPARNRNNMLKIILDLNEAVQNVAKAEGFVDSYESFSDIFKLDLEDHTQYVPTLWSGNMSPPNPSYGEVVTKLKSQILESILKKDLRIQFTFQTFCSRLMSVDKALKEENFVLNFEDVSRAIAYNDFSIQCNKWLVDVRAEVTDKRITWQRKMKAIPNNEREQLSQDFKHEIADEMDNQREKVREKLKLYLQKNKDEKYSYKDHFTTWIEASLSNIESEIQLQISNEVKALQRVATDVPTFVDEMTKEIRLEAVKKATSLRESDFKEHDCQHLQAYFEKFWDGSRNAILRKYQLQEISEKDIRKKCSTLLQKVCTGNAIEREVSRLIDSEGDISNHSQDFDCEKYIPIENFKEGIWGSEKKWQVKREKKTKSIKLLVEEVKETILRKFETDCHGKAFDQYLVYTTLQKALANLTLTENPDNIKLPCSLIAKVLLHICGKISELATNKNSKHQTENPCKDLFDKKKVEIYLEFKSFYCDMYQNDRAYQYVCKLISQQFMRYTLDRLRSKIISVYSNSVIQTKRNLHAMVLKYLFEQNKPLLYINYINNNVEFLIDWLREMMIHAIGTKKDNISWIQSQYKEILNNIPHLSNSIVQELSKANSMKEWCEKFTKSLSEQQQLQIDLQEAFVYQVSNVDELSTNVVTFYRKILNGETRTNVPLPEPGNFAQCETFLNLALNCPYEDVVRSFLGCRAQCPFCKAPCSEENLAKHKHHVLCHYPRGLAGRKWESNKLVEEFCSSSVDSNVVHYGKDGEFCVCKKPVKHYPSWKFQTNDDPRMRYYWMRVFHLINKKCSKYFFCKPAEIPTFWASEYVHLKAKSVVHALSFSDKIQLLLHDTLVSSLDALTTATLQLFTASSASTQWN